MWRYCVLEDLHASSVCLIMVWLGTFTFTFMHLADAFIQSDLHCIQVTVSTFDQLLLSLGIEPMILALLTPCSTSWATGKLYYSLPTVWTVHTCWACYCAGFLLLACFWRGLVMGSIVVKDWWPQLHWAICWVAQSKALKLRFFQACWCYSNCTIGHYT